MAPQAGRVEHRHGVVGGEIGAVVVQLLQLQGGNQPIGAVARDQIHPPVRQGPVGEAQIHGAGRGGEAQSVACRQARETIRAVEKFVAKGRAPLAGGLHRIADRAQAQPLAIGLADEDREAVFEPQGGEHAQAITFVVELTRPLPHRRPPLGRQGRLAQDRRPGRARVLHVAIDAPLAYGLVEQKGAAQAELPFHPQGRVCLNLLGQELPQQQLLGVALGAHHNRFAACKFAARGFVACGSQPAPGDGDGQQGRHEQGPRQQLAPTPPPPGRPLAATPAALAAALGDAPGEAGF